jgi:hypothetical protein
MEELARVSFSPFTFHLSPLSPLVAAEQFLLQVTCIY